MKFKFLVVFSILSGSTLAHAQNTFPLDAAVGIGTLSPGAPLHVFVGPDSKPGGVVSAAQKTLKLSRFGTGNSRCAASCIRWSGQQARRCGFSCSANVKVIAVWYRKL